MKSLPYLLTRGIARGHGTTPGRVLEAPRAKLEDWCVFQPVNSDYYLEIVQAERTMKECKRCLVSDVTRRPLFIGEFKGQFSAVNL